MMENFFLAIITGLVIIIFAMLYRVIIGPSIYDRINALLVIGADIILLLIVIGFYLGRVGMYIDISIAYGVLSFLILVVLARYFTGKET